MDHRDAVAAAVAQALAAKNERLRAILDSFESWGREVAAVKLAIASPNLQASEILEFIARLPARTGAGENGHRTIAERLGKAGIELCLGPPTGNIGDRSRTEQIIDKINKRNGFQGSDANLSGAADRGAKPRYRVAARSVGVPPEVGDASNKQNV
jgi:hypothetical protein